jgi:uncharacterized protein YjbI with pentapeptide repeats
MTNAVLSGANMYGAVMIGVSMSGVTWTNTICPSGQQGPYPCS